MDVIVVLKQETAPCLVTVSRKIKTTLLSAYSKIIKNITCMRFVVKKIKIIMRLVFGLAVQLQQVLWPLPELLPIRLQDLQRGQAFSLQSFC
jgi:hypothetical protein